MAAPAPVQAGDCIGLAALARLVFEGADLQPVWEPLVARATAASPDAGALMDIATLRVLTGEREAGLALQALALERRRLYRRPAAKAGGLRLLALMTAGDMMANTPLDFLLEGSDIELLSLYVDADGLPAGPLPEHDAAFLAVGESEANLAVLRAIAPALRDWPRPLINADALRIAALTRDGVCALLDGAAEIVAPATARLERATLARLAQGEIAVGALLEGADFPIIARPIGSHAGTGLSKLDDAAAVAGYLEAQPAEQVYVAPFVDYAGADGQFRKQRIALIQGRPFVCHLAVSRHWMVHYMNAAMLECAENRDEEARFMETFDQAFAVRHRAAFERLSARIGLDYFAIDCAETRDGRLLLFEADVAMIVHAMDPPSLFPYKGPQMRKVFSAFQAMVAKAARPTAAAAAGGESPSTAS
jgi:hypothetical protein